VHAARVPCARRKSWHRSVLCAEKSTGVSRGCGAPANAVGSGRVTHRWARIQSDSSGVALAVDHDAAISVVASKSEAVCAGFFLKVRPYPRNRSSPLETRQGRAAAAIAGSMSIDKGQVRLAPDGQLVQASTVRAQIAARRALIGDAGAVAKAVVMTNFLPAFSAGSRSFPDDTRRAAVKQQDFRHRRTSGRVTGQAGRLRISTAPGLPPGFALRTNPCHPRRRASPGEAGLVDLPDPQLPSKVMKTCALRHAGSGGGPSASAGCHSRRRR